MHSLSFLSSGRNWKLQAASTSVLTRIEGEGRGVQTSFINRFHGLLLPAEGKNPSPQILSSATSRSDKPDSGIHDFFPDLLESLFPAKVYAERLKKSVKLIKKEREWEGSTQAALKMEKAFTKRQTFHKVTVYFTSTSNAGRNNRQAFRTCALSVFCFSTYTEDNRDALYEY